MLFFRFLLLHVLVFVLYTTASAQVMQLHIEQLHAQMPTLNAYIDVRDTEHQSVADLEVGQFVAHIGGVAAQNLQLQTFGSSHEGIAYIFLIDVSRSMSPHQFVKLQQAIFSWMTHLKANDQVALMSFGEKVTVISDFTNNVSAIHTAVQQLRASDSQTQLYQALLDAINLSTQRDEQLPQRRMIVLLTDGLNDASASVTQGEVRQTLSQHLVPIFTMGFSDSDKQKQQDALAFMAEISRESGGHYLETSMQDFEQAYTLMHQHIQQSYVLTFQCPRCRTDSQLHRVEIGFTENGRSQSRGVDIRLHPSKQRSATIPDTEYQQWLWALLALTIMVVLFFMRRQKKLKMQAALALAEMVTPTMRKQIASAKVRVEFTMMNGRYRGNMFQHDIIDHVTIGRSKKCDLCFADDIELSGQHCSITKDVSGLFVQDLGSVNVTLVNGVPLKALRLLKNSDVLTLGRTELRVGFKV